jgi:4-amino-4-deoxy-L-arabinose transferase-like glycosyltransferase
MNMTLQNAINRGYNLLACTALALAGLAFGTVVLEEADLLDKVDDIGFLVIGAVAVIWYLLGRNRFKRSVVPIVLSGTAIIVQIVGLVLEKDDPASFGDNIGGMWLFVPLFVVLVVQFYLNRSLLVASAEVTPASEPSAISAESQH